MSNIRSKKIAALRVGAFFLKMLWSFMDSMIHAGL
jgi:hypothetical protein